MTQYQVISVGETRNWTHKEHGNFVDYDLSLAGADKPVVVTQKADTPAPQVGASLDLDLSPHPYFTDSKYKGKKVQPAGGFSGGGGRGRSPEENARIVRQHSQAMALKMVELMGPEAQREATGSLNKLKGLIDWFHADAMNAAVQVEPLTGQPAVVQPGAVTPPLAAGGAQNWGDDDSIPFAAAF